MEEAHGRRKEETARRRRRKGRAEKKGFTLGRETTENIP